MNKMNGNRSFKINKIKSNRAILLNNMTKSIVIFEKESNQDGDFCGEYTYYLYDSQKTLEEIINDNYLSSVAIFENKEQAEKTLKTKTKWYNAWSVEEAKHNLNPVDYSAHELIISID